MSITEFFQRVSRGKLKKSARAPGACYVLITCDQPTPDGKMCVEMTYEGDAALAAYLIESAKGLMDERASSQ